MKRRQSNWEPSFLAQSVDNPMTVFFLILTLFLVCFLGLILILLFTANGFVLPNRLSKLAIFLERLGIFLQGIGLLPTMIKALGARSTTWYIQIQRSYRRLKQGRPDRVASFVFMTTFVVTGLLCILSAFIVDLPGATFCLRLSIIGYGIAIILMGVIDWQMSKYPIDRRRAPSRQLARPLLIFLFRWIDEPIDELLLKWTLPLVFFGVALQLLSTYFLIE